MYDNDFWSCINWRVLYSSRTMSYNHSERMIKKRKPYELQYVPVFFIIFCMLSTLQNIMNFPPLVNVFKVRFTL